MTDESQQQALTSYLEGIDFRWFQPDFPTAAFKPLDRLARLLGKSLEVANTTLPDDQLAMKLRLRPLCDIPRMSTFAIGAMINRAVSQLRPDQCFLNVGVWNGFTLLCGMADNPQAHCIGVDNFSEFGGPRDAFMQRFESRRSEQHEFFDMGYRSYLDSQHQAEIGFYIYDGEHSYRNQLHGLQAAEPFLADDALILVDDTNWEAPRKATLDFMESSDNDYRILFDSGTCFPGHPTYWNGVMVFQRC